MLHLAFADFERRAGRAGLREACAAMPSVFAYSEFVAAMRFSGGAAGDGAETAKVVLSEARRDGWIVGLFGHCGGQAGKQLPVYFNIQRQREHPAGRLALARSLPVWRPWLERAVGMGALSAVAIGRGVIEDAGGLPRRASTLLEVTGEDARINVHEDIQPWVRVARRPSGWMQALSGLTRPMSDRRAPLVALVPGAALADLLILGAAALSEDELDTVLARWHSEDEIAFRTAAARLQPLRPRRGRSAPVMLTDTCTRRLARDLWAHAQATALAPLPQAACA